MLIDGNVLLGPVGPLSDLLHNGKSTDEDAVAITSAERVMTWRQLDEVSTSLAVQYRGLGLEPGDRIASLMPNRVELVIHYLACFKAALVATPLNYRYTAREIDHALEVSEAAAIVAHAERAEDLAASRLVGTLRQGTIVYGDAGSGAGGSSGSAAGSGNDRHSFERLLVGPAPVEVELVPPGLSDPAAIFFTSGSTGPAKGVTHSHETLRWMFASTAAGFEMTADDVCMPASSMSHIGSFMWALVALSVGARVVVVRSYDAHEVLPLLRAHRPTILAMLPAALAALVRDNDVSPEDFSCLRICRAGADKVSTELLAEFSALAGFPIDEGYGMTEVGLATLNPPSGLIKQGSIGRPVGGFSIAVRDEDNGQVGPGTVGRVWIKTRSTMVGYWRADEATDAVMRDGWLDSGDLARADDEGYLWFFGRKKQIIVHDGSNISPLEIEGTLMEHPALALAGVVGIHDVVHGENVRAYVTLRPGVPCPTSDELILFCRARVGYKAPEEIVVLDDMPLNPTGKIDRVGLKRLAEEHLHPHGLETGSR